MTRKNNVFEDYTWFKFDELGLKLDMNFKFCTSVSKEFKLKFRNYEAFFPTFLEVTAKKMVQEVFLVLNKLKFRTLTQLSSFIFLIENGSKL